MMDQTSLQTRRSLKYKLLAYSLGLTTFIILVIAAIGVYAVQTTGRQAQEISSNTLRDQARDYLTRLTQAQVRENDQIMGQVMDDVSRVAAYAVSVYDEAQALSAEPFYDPQVRMFTGTNGQWMNSAEETTTVFVPATMPVDEAVRRDVALGGYLNLMLPSIFSTYPNAEAIYFGTPRDVLRYYPNVDIGNVVPPDFQASQRIWFTGSTLQNNPQRATWWTPVYEDATGRGLVTTAAAPAYDEQGQLLGVAGFDISLDEMRTKIESTTFLQAGYAFLIDSTGRAIALPPQGYRDILGRDPLPDENGVQLENIQPEFKVVMDRMLGGNNGFEAITISGRELFIAYAPLSTTGWSLGSVVAADDVLQSIPTLEKALAANTQDIILSRALPIVLAILMIAIILSLVFTGRMVNPIQKLAEAAIKIGAGEWDAPIPTGGSDEIGLLGRSFESMTARLRELVTGLENRVAERTRALEERSSTLQAASEVMRDISAARSLDSLLNRSVNLISRHMNYYQVTIFLLDERQEYAVMRAASGEIGQKLMERYAQSPYRLRIGQEGIVGIAIADNHPRLVEDVTQDLAYHRDPLLPLTASELVLPLHSRDRLIGALDVQVDASHRFTQEEITVLQTLGDQIGIAIENLSLVEELQTALQESSSQYEQDVQAAWSRTSAARAYAYDLLAVKPVAGQDNLLQQLPDEVSQKLMNGLRVTFRPENGGAALLVPVMLRSEVIGVIGLQEVDADYEWSSDEVAVVEAAATQAAITLENARLLEESQRRAAQERTLAEATARMRETLDIQSVLQTATDEIYQALGLSEMTVWLSPRNGQE